MTRNELKENIFSKKSYLCTGLDTELSKMPSHLPQKTESILSFNRQIIDSTEPYSVAYKLNTAFYERYGSQGWEVMEETVNYLPANVFKIADAKRGDIGNTSTMYAQAFFETMKFDAVTVSPYMGEDSLRPFLEFPDKWIICLALTSNPGHKDFQLLEYQGKKLYETVIEQVCKYGNENNLMFVVGATRASEIGDIRKLIPQHFLLVPGVGAQGGSLKEVSHYGFNKDCGLLVNSSRGILYASSGEDFAEKAGETAKSMQNEMALYFP